MPPPKSNKSRYTPPAPTDKKKPSPVWYVVLVLALMGLGVLVIILNYIQLLPGTDGGATNAYLGLGLGMLLAGFVLLVRLR